MMEETSSGGVWVLIGVDLGFFFFFFFFKYGFLFQWDFGGQWWCGGHGRGAVVVIGQWRRGARG